jgi:hypothetical protein
MSIHTLWFWKRHDIHHVRKVVDAVLELREDRVTAAKAALENGTLNLNEVELAEKLFHYEVERVRALERIRQEKETFKQIKEHTSRWFTLRLVMGYS